MGKKSESSSDFAMSKTIREQREYLPIYAVKEEVSYADFIELEHNLHVFLFYSC